MAMLVTIKNSSDTIDIGAAAETTTVADPKISAPAVLTDTILEPGDNPMTLDAEVLELIDATKGFELVRYNGIPPVPPVTTATVTELAPEVYVTKTVASVR